MAEKKKPYFKQNADKKTVTIDYSVKPTAAEDHAVKMLLAAGYNLKTKSEVKSKQAAARVDKLTNADIEDALKNDKKNLEIYREIKSGKGKGKGFFAAKKWYIDNIQK